MSSSFEHAIKLMENGLVTPENMARMALASMSNSSIESMLRLNDLMFDVPNVTDGKSMVEWVQRLIDNPALNDAVNSANGLSPEELAELETKSKLATDDDVEDDSEYSNLPPDKYYFGIYREDEDPDCDPEVDNIIAICVCPVDYLDEDGYMYDGYFTSPELVKMISDPRVHDYSENTWEFDGTEQEAIDYVKSFGFIYNPKCNEPGS
jgi:hypothetical protein